VPIIALTANALIGNDKKFLEKGFQAFLSKPIDVVKLDEVLNEWVRKGQYGNMSPDSVGFLSNSHAGKSSYHITKHHIEGVDLAAGVSCFGSEDAYLQIIRSYVMHTPALVEKMRTVSAETLGGYAIMVHGLKSSSYGICANTIGKMAENLESAAKRGEFKTVKSDNDAFIRAMESLILELRTLEGAVHSETQDASRELKAAPDDLLLKKLLVCSSRYDVVGMENVLVELERYEYETQGELISWLREIIYVSA
jgi:CheY-like chemotaxis protein